MQARIRSIQAFGRNARRLCTFLFVLGVALCAVPILMVLFGESDASVPADGGPYDMLTSPLAPMSLRLLAALAACMSIGIWVAAIRQLQRLFGNLASGAIHTAENVHRVRNVGLLWLLTALFDIASPTTVAVAHRLMDSPVPFDAAVWFPSSSELLMSFISAALVLLVSWVMDVGLHAREMADALQRDAELTI